MVETKVPLPRAQVPIATDDGRLTNAWFRFFQLLWVRTGGGTDIIAESAPTGAIFDFAGDTPPAGWLECDGADVSRATYIDLFNTVGTLYGSGDGSTTFGLPDCRGRMPVGSGTGVGLSPRAVAATGGVEGVGLVQAENGPHAHGVTDTGHSHAVTDAGHSHGITDAGHDHAPNSGNFVLDNAGTEYDNANGDKGTTDGTTASATTGVTVDSATTGVTVDSGTTGVTVDSGTTGVTVNVSGSGDAHENMTPFIVFLKIIKT